MDEARDLLEPGPGRRHQPDVSPPDPIREAEPDAVDEARPALRPHHEEPAGRGPPLERDLVGQRDAVAEQEHVEPGGERLVGLGRRMGAGHRHQRHVGAGQPPRRADDRARRLAPQRPLVAPGARRGTPRPAARAASAAAALSARTAMTRSADPARLASAGRRSVSSSSRRFRSVAITRAAARTPGSARTRSVTCMSATESTKVSGRTRPRVTMAARAVVASSVAPRPEEESHHPVGPGRGSDRERAAHGRAEIAGRPRPGGRRRTGSSARGARPGSACVEPGAPERRGAARGARDERRPSRARRAAPSSAQRLRRPGSRPRRSRRGGRPPTASARGPAPPDRGRPAPRTARRRRTAASTRSRAADAAAPDEPRPEPMRVGLGRPEERQERLPRPSATTVARAVRSRSTRSARRRAGGRAGRGSQVDAAPSVTRQSAVGWSRQLARRPSEDGDAGPGHAEPGVRQREVGPRRRPRGRSARAGRPASRGSGAARPRPRDGTRDAGPRSTTARAPPSSRSRTHRLTRTARSGVRLRLLNNSGHRRGNV